MSARTCRGACGARVRSEGAERGCSGKGAGRGSREEGAERAASACTAARSYYSMQCICRGYAVAMPWLCRGYAVAMVCVSMSCVCRGYAALCTAASSCCSNSTVERSSTRCVARDLQKSRRPPSSANSALLRWEVCAHYARRVHAVRMPCACRAHAVRMLRVCSAVQCKCVRSAAQRTCTRRANGSRGPPRHRARAREQSPAAAPRPLAAPCARAVAPPPPRAAGA